MNTFLSDVAQKLKELHPSDLDKVTVVFNNQRSGLFLRKQFAEMAEHPLFLPRIIGIDQLVSEIGDLQIVPNEFLLFELYDIHRHQNNNNEKFKTFEEFMSFGDIMLSDFSEIDLYCIDAKQLFSNLHDLKAIGEWDIETGTLTPFQKKYLAFYQSLHQYYTQLHERLLSKHHAFNGMAYRYVAENIERLMCGKKSRPTYFVGFNAISTSEEKIINYFIKNNKGKIYTDGDAYYFNDPKQETGYFLRKHNQQYPQNHNITKTSHPQYPNHFENEEKTITIISCPEDLLQCKYAGNIITEQLLDSNSGTLEHTAIVLADETLLLPTLNALPKNIRSANVTMGYPFVSTDCHALMLKLFAIQVNRREGKYYHHDILNLLDGSILSNIPEISKFNHGIKQLLTQEHIIYTDFDTLCSKCQMSAYWAQKLADIFPDKTLSVEDFLHISTQFLSDIQNVPSIAQNAKETEALKSLLQLIEYLQQLQQEYHYIETLNILLKIYTRLTKRISVPFYGEPLSGLQILGVLETRNLDFKELILLSANEGILPSEKSSNTLIPYSLKKVFCLPTFHEKDAVFAYNFYRLLQRAKNVQILYSTESDGTGKGGASRFILQIRDELAKKYPNIRIYEKIVSSQNILPPQSDNTAQKKTPQIIQRLHDIAQHGFSASALNTYRGCPMRFYYEKVLTLKDIDEVNEDLTQDELGTYIHAILQYVHTIDKDGILQQNTLQYSLDNIDSIIDQFFKDQFQHGRSHTGRNHFLKAISKTQITRFLQGEIAQLNNGNSIRIINVETELRATLSMEINGCTQLANIHGIADRIDIVDGITRIIDYKSGRTEKSEMLVKEAIPNPYKVSDKWFQVMLYSWLYHHNLNCPKNFIAGIVPLKNLNSTLLEAMWEESAIITENHIARFETMLTQIVSDILNPDLPFIPTPNKNQCPYCPMAEICHEYNRSNCTKSF